MGNCQALPALAQAESNGENVPGRQGPDLARYQAEADNVTEKRLKHIVMIVGPLLILLAAVFLLNDRERWVDVGWSTELFPTRFERCLSRVKLGMSDSDVMATFDGFPPSDRKNPDGLLSPWNELPRAPKYARVFSDSPDPREGNYCIVVY